MMPYYEVTRIDIFAALSASGVAWKRWSCRRVEDINYSCENSSANNGSFIFGLHCAKLVVVDLALIASIRASQNNYECRWLRETVADDAEKEPKWARASS